MDAAVEEEWFGGDPSGLDAACAEADLLPWWQVSEVEADADWAPLSVAETLALVRGIGPCAESLRLLETLDQQTLTPEQHLDVAELLQPLRHAIAGRQLSAMVGYAGEKTPKRTKDFRNPADFQVTELSWALNIGENFTARLLANARGLATVLSATGDLLRSGRLSDYKASLVVEKLGHLDPELAATVQAKILPHLVADSPAQLQRRMRRALLKAQPAVAEQEHREGPAKRQVRVGTPDAADPGLLGLHAVLPPETVLAIYARLRQVAAGFDQHDGRTREQRIADAFTLLLLGPSEDDPQLAAKPRVVVNVTMDLLTLFWLREHPGELAGYGPVPAAIARELAADAQEWSRFVYDPVTGYLLDVGPKRYVPPKPLRRFVKARDVFCRFPGSTRKAIYGDDDHIEAFDRTGNGHGGSTSASNLGSQSRKSHRAKTHGGFTVHGDANAELTWITSTGRTYTSRPHDYRPDPDEPPGPPPPPHKITDDDEAGPDIGPPPF
jgi:hypothetical protein